jgi:hypothetical protein
MIYWPQLKCLQSCVYLFLCTIEFVEMLQVLSSGFQDTNEYLSVTYSYNDHVYMW